MNEELIKQVLTRPSAIEFFKRMFCNDVALLSISERADRVGKDRASIRNLMDAWEHSKGAFGLAFIRMSADADNKHRYTCMKAWKDYVRREELAAAQRAEIGYRGARYK